MDTTLFLGLSFGCFIALGLAIDFHHIYRYLDLLVGRYDWIYAIAGGFYFTSFYGDFEEPFVWTLLLFFFWAVVVETGLGKFQQASLGQRFWGLQITRRDGTVPGGLQLLGRSLLKHWFSAASLTGIAYAVYWGMDMTGVFYSSHYSAILAIILTVIASLNWLLTHLPIWLPLGKLLDWVSGTCVVDTGRREVSTLSAGLIFATSSLGVSLTLLGLPFFIISCRHCKDLPYSQANMHTLQTMVETYMVDWGGLYPPDLQALYREATLPGKEYWKEMHNMFTAEPGIGKSLLDYKILKNTPEKCLGFEGAVIYEAVGTPPIRYYIYGCDIRGRFGRDRKRQYFFLTNS